MRLLSLVLILLLASCNRSADANADNSSPSSRARARVEDRADAAASESTADVKEGAEHAPSESAGAEQAGDQPAAEEQDSVGEAEAQPADPQADGSNAADEIPLGIAYTYYFNEDNAWKHLVKQVNFGFRVPGTEAHRNCKAWLKGELEKTCDAVFIQEFSVPLSKGPTPFYNIMGRINPNAPRRILLCAHWDTRPTSEKNPAGKRHLPIPGANDGASGVAILLELARVFSERNPPEVGVDILLFDGEDYGPGLDMMFLGAKYYASKISRSELSQYNYGVLIDMVGDKDLDIHPENHSEGAAGKIYGTAFDIAEDLGYNNFKSHGAYTIFDDHLPLIERGMKIYDFIDFNYEHWHTTEDTVDKCDRESLKVVGHVLENMVYMHPEIYKPQD